VNLLDQILALVGIGFVRPRQARKSRAELRNGIVVEPGLPVGRRCAGPSRIAHV
jgi:hypothetical protein